MRRRRGSTSPPLVGIEPNPGPKEVRKKSHKAKRQQKHLTPEERQGIMEDLKDSNLSRSRIAIKWRVNEKTITNIERVASGEEPKKRGRPSAPVKRKEPEKRDPEHRQAKKAKKQEEQSPQLTELEKGEMKALLTQGMSKHQVARVLNRGRTTVQRWAARLDSADTRERKTDPGSGRPRITSTTLDRAIQLALKRRTKITANKIAAELANLEGKPYGSHRTILRRIEEGPFKCVRILKKPLLTTKHAKARFKWAQEHLNWTLSQWERVLWSDESPFKIWLSPSREVIWIRTDIEDPAQRIVSQVKHGGGGLHVWGCFSAHGVGPLVRVKGQMNSSWYHGILTHHAMPHLKQLMASQHKRWTKKTAKWYYQHDNAKAHIEKGNSRYLLSKQVESNGRMRVLEWPSNSPDLNPIENLWHYLKDKLEKYESRPTSLDNLWERIKKEWEAIPQEMLRNLAESMPNRVDEVIDKHGWSVKY